MIIDNTKNVTSIYWQYLWVFIMWLCEENVTFDRWFYYIISVVSVIADGWCGNKKDVRETSGIWWKDKEEALVSNVDIDG